MRKTNVFFLSVVFLLSANASPDPQVTPPPTPTIARRQVAGGAGTPILSTLHYAYTALPYQVYPYPVLRGPQYGFNQCNASTLGPTSNCQTLIFNGPVRFKSVQFSSPEAYAMAFVCRTIFVFGDPQIQLGS